jgi:hypothetical protein
MVSWGGFGVDGSVLDFSELSFWSEFGRLRRLLVSDQKHVFSGVVASSLNVTEEVIMSW